MYNFRSWFSPLLSLFVGIIDIAFVNCTNQNFNTLLHRGKAGLTCPKYLSVREEDLLSLSVAKVTQKSPGFVEL